MHRSYRTGVGFGSGVMPPGVKQLILITGGVYLVQLLVPAVTVLFGLYPPAVLSLQVWRLFTYMFLHGGLFHLLMNMFVLYMFGSQLEQVWGRRRFVRYYLLCGVGAGLFALLPLPAFFDALHIGASGAVYGLLLAFGLLFPSAQVYLLGILPMSARHMVILFGFISLAGSLAATSDGVSHIAHLGGLGGGIRPVAARRPDSAATFPPGHPLARPPAAAAASPVRSLLRGSAPPLRDAALTAWWLSGRVA